MILGGIEGTDENGKPINKIGVWTDKGFVETQREKLFPPNIKTAALEKYPIHTVDETVMKQKREAFEKGAEWGIKQTANDAVEFAEWVHNADWYYIKERDYWVTGDGIDELNSKQFHPRITRTSQELYQLYLKTKKYEK